MLSGAMGGLMGCWVLVEVVEGGGNRDWGVGVVWGLLVGSGGGGFFVKGGLYAYAED